MVGCALQLRWDEVTRFLSRSDFLPDMDASGVCLRWRAGKGAAKASPEELASLLVRPPAASVRNFTTLASLPKATLLPNVWDLFLARQD
jgi:hypothetical protein